MPRQKGIGKGETERFNIRMDKDTAHFYRKKANEHGLSVSEFLRQMLMHGIIAENVQEIEERLKHTASEIQADLYGSRAMTIPDPVLLSVLTSEALLKSIVEARDIQKLYEAQNTAQATLKQIKGA